MSQTKPARRNRAQGRWWVNTALGTTFGVAFTVLSSTAFADDIRSNGSDHGKTATPIKHVIVLIGENRTFDNVFATYVPRNGQAVSNLLSRGIINANGQPGPNWAAARQFQVGNINPVAYFINTNTLKNPNKTAYGLLPSPEVGGVPPTPVTKSQFLKDPVDTLPPFDGKTFSTADLTKITQGLNGEDLGLLTTGATGQTNAQNDPTLPPAAAAEADLRIPGGLPNTVFQITGSRKMPYDSYTGDMVHRFYHMWQQSDCDVADANKTNPSGCKNDLYPFVGIARGDDSGGSSMGFYNMQKGDVPLFRKLADDLRDERQLSSARHGRHRGPAHDAVHRRCAAVGGCQRLSRSAAGQQSGRSHSEKRDQRRVHGRPALERLRRFPAGLHGHHELPEDSAVASGSIEDQLHAGDFLHGQQHPSGISLERCSQYRARSTTAPRRRRRRCGISAMPSTRRRSAGPITAAASMRRLVSTTDRKTRSTC